MTLPAVHPFLMEVLRGLEPEAPARPALENPDWEEVVSGAAAHGLIPLLFRWLKRSDLGRGLPPGLAESLDEQVFGLAALNMVLADELKSVLRAFEARGLPCAPLRGLALAERIHRDITARPMGDVDLLVRKKDVPAAAAILGDLGFREIDRRPGFARAFSYTLELLKGRHGWIVIEPHWTLTYPPFVDRIDMDAVWDRCVRGQVVGVETWLLSGEDLLFHLCLHLAHKDASAPLLWWYELDRLVRLEQAALDWSRVLSLARHGRLEFLVAQVLGRVTALFATPIPDHVLGELTAEHPSSFDRRLARLLARASDVDGKESLAVFLALGGFRERLSYALGLLFPSPQFMRLQSGETGRAGLLAAYVRRCCRLAWAGSRGVARLLR